MIIRETEHVLLKTTDVGPSINEDNLLFPFWYDGLSISHGIWRAQDKQSHAAQRE